MSRKTINLEPPREPMAPVRDENGRILQLLVFTPSMFPADLRVLRRMYKKFDRQGKSKQEFLRAFENYKDCLRQAMTKSTKTAIDAFNSAPGVATLPKTKVGLFKRFKNWLRSIRWKLSKTVN